MVSVSPLQRTRLADPRHPTGQEVAAAVNIHSSFYYLIEAGERSVSVELAEELAGYFSVTVESLFRVSRYQAVQAGA